MVDFFGCGETSIMTRRAVIHDADVIEDPRYKPRGLVAIAAIAVGWDMVRGRGFPHGGCTIVARRTVVNYIQVIELGTSKGRGVMAHRAILQRGNIYRNMTHRQADRGNTMAGCTVIHDTDMIEHCWLKGAGDVTDTTVLSG